MASSVPGKLSCGIVQDEASLVPSSGSIPAPVSLAPVSSPAEDSLDPSSSPLSPVVPVSGVSCFSVSGVSCSSVSGGSRFVRAAPRFPEDPVAHALCIPVVADPAATSSLDPFDAAWESGLLPAVGAVSSPVTGDARSPASPRLGASLPGSVGPLGNSVPAVPSLGFDFGVNSFPPLSKSSLLSNSGEPDASGGLAASPTVHPVVENPLTAGASWASLVSDSHPLMKLSYFKPNSSSSEGRVSYYLPPEIARIGAAAWETTIVGFFLDKLPFSFVESTARRLWNNKGLMEVLSNGSGFFFFKFSNKAEMSGILDGGPWYFGGRPIFLKPWRPGMILSKDGCKKVPIWARFFNIPLEFWTAEGLSRIASIVGTPLHADQMTSSLKRLSFARICLEISIDDSLPNSLDLSLEDGRSVEVLIEYNWVPKRCPVCKVFGHLPENCKKSVRQYWVPKSSFSSAGLSDVAPTSAGQMLQPPVNHHGSNSSMVGHVSSDPLPAAGTSVSGGCMVSNSFSSLQDIADAHVVRKVATFSQSLSLAEASAVPVAVVKDICPPSPVIVSELLEPESRANFEAAGCSSLGSSVIDVDDLSWKDALHHNHLFNMAPVMSDSSVAPLRESLSIPGRDELQLVGSSASGGFAAAIDSASLRVLGSASKELRKVGDTQLLSYADASDLASVPVRETRSSSPGSDSGSDCLSPIPLAILCSPGGSGDGTQPAGVDEPSSPSSNSITPLLARRLIMVDELEKKQGKRINQKKKRNKSAGNSRGISS